MTRQDDAAKQPESDPSRATAGAPSALLSDVARFLDVESRTQREFENSRLEYRRLFSEVWGTFLLVLVAAGAPVVATKPYGGGLTMVANVLAPGMRMCSLPE